MELNPRKTALTFGAIGSIFLLFSHYMIHISYSLGMGRYCMMRHWIMNRGIMYGSEATPQFMPFGMIMVGTIASFIIFFLFGWLFAYIYNKA